MWAAAACGAVFGLALARFLFELEPGRFGLLDTWAGALGLACAGLAAVAGFSVFLSSRARALPRAPWAPLALALAAFSLWSPDVNLLRSIVLLVGAVVLCALLAFAAPPQTPEGIGSIASQPHTPTLPYSLFLFLILFLLYLRTMAPAVGQADTFEFQVDVARLGIAHGSGYPLLMLVGRLFTLLPVGGTLAFRANLSSAFFAALAAVGVERIARRLGVEPIVAGLAGLAFGVSPTLWSRAVEIEVFALNAAFVAAILYLCVDLIHGPPSLASNSQSPAPKLPPRLMLLAFLFGLSLTNHLTSLFLGLACLLAGWTAVQRQRRQGANPTPAARSLTAAPAGSRSATLSSGTISPSIRVLTLLLVCFLVGLSVYLYLPLRWPAVNHGQPLSLAGFANILTGSEARGAFNWRLPLQDSSRYGIVWSKLFGDFGWPGLALAALGIASLILPSRRTHVTEQEAGAQPHPSLHLSGFEWPITNLLTALAFIVTALGYIYFGLAFNVPDPSFSSYLIPVHLISAILMALGVQWLVTAFTRLNFWLSAPDSGIRPLASSLQRPVLPPLAACLLLSAFCLLALSALWHNYPLVDHSNDWAAQQFGELMLSQPLAHGAAVLADSQKIAPLDYLQIAEGQRPDLDIIVLPDEASYRSAIQERLAAGQVVYLGRYLPGLAADYSLRSVGPLAEVSTAPFTSTVYALTAAIAQPIANGISLAGYANAAGLVPLSARASGELDVTLAWQARAVPTDNLLVSLRLVDEAGQPAWQSAGSVPVAGLYPTNAWRQDEIVSDFYRIALPANLPPGAYRLEVALLPPFSPAPASAWTEVGPVTILASANPVAPPHALRDQLGAGWLLGYDVPEAAAPGSHVPVTLYWLSSAEEATVTAFGEAHSLAAWPAGTVVPVVYDLSAPTSGDHFDFVVDAGQPARCGWLASVSAACPLPPVRLAGQAAAAGAVNFDNQILLNRATLRTSSVAPAGVVKVDLEWQALRAIGADYTVFVHLLGPDGVVHGQVDLWPVSGTRATSGWAPGERIFDPYTIQLPADAPTGAYQVEVGLYLLATGERLPVLNGDGAPVDDRYLLRGLEVVAP